MSSPLILSARTPKNKIGFALSTKERTHLTEKILAGLDCGGFDLIWCDGSTTTEGKAFAGSCHFKNTPLVEIHFDVRGGPDAAIQFSLKRLLAMGYDCVGLIENDIQLKPGWLEAMMTAWQAAQKDGFNVGAVTARTIASRVLARAQAYTVQWNLGAGMSLFSRAGAEAVLANYHVTNAKALHEFYLSRFGINIADAWELFADQPDRALGADWHYAASLLEQGMVSLAVTPNYAENVDTDIEALCRTQFVRSADQPLPAHCLPANELLALLNKKTDAGRASAKRNCWCGGSLEQSVNPFYGKCQSCGTLILERTPSAEELKKYYSLQGYWYEHQKRDCGFPDIEKRAAADLNDRIPVWHRALTQAGAEVESLLEIGCAHGGFLNYCRERGVQTVVGVEVDEDTCRFARSHFNLPHVCAGLFPAVSLPLDRFDAITGFDVLEHFLDPVAALKSVASKLSDDGIFMFQTPCYRGEDGKWPQFKPDEHIFLYNTSSIRTLCDRAGLEVVDVAPGCFPDDMFVIGRKKSAEPRPVFSVHNPDRILFVRTDSIGDAVIASSMLEPIQKKYPRAKLAMLCQLHVADLFLACPHLDSIICYERQKMDLPAEREKIFSEIAAFKPDLIVNSVRSRDRLSNELTLSFRTAQHIAIESDLNNISPEDHNRSLVGYDRLISSPGIHKPELQRHADFLHALEIEPGVMQPVVWTSPTDEELAAAFFKQENLDSQRTLALFPFTQHDWKDYPAFTEVLKSFGDWNILIFGGPENRQRCDVLAKQLSGRIWNLAGRTNLRLMAALIRRCRLLLGSDTCGPHIACAVGVPNVVILGGGHFGRFLPYSPLTSAVALPLDCFGCNWTCPHSRHHCVKDISAKLVVKAITQTLQKNSTRPRLFVQSHDSWKTNGKLPKWQQPDNLLVGADVEIIGATPAQNEEADVEIIGKGIPNPIVTVVVSAYKSEKFMRPCLDNLSQQTIFNKCEIIVIDSGSPENERAIVAEFQQKFPNIRYVRTPRETLHQAWNRGLAMASGRYWANVNTDDTLRNDALEILAAALEKHTDCAIAFADSHWTTKPNDTFPSSNTVRTVKYFDYSPIQSLFYCYTSCLQFYRTESFRHLGGFDPSLRCAGDYDANLKMMVAGFNAVHVPETLTLFYQNTTGLTQAADHSAKEQIQIMNNYRANLDISKIFEIPPRDSKAAADAWAAVGIYAMKFAVPWEDNLFEHNDFAHTSFLNALNLDPENRAAGTHLVVLSHKSGRLDADEPEMMRRWPKMREWINHIRAGGNTHVPSVHHAVIGPVYRPFELSSRPTLEQLSNEPAALRQWISRIDGRHVYLSEDLFPSAKGIRLTPEELRLAAMRLISLLKELPPFYAHLGGAGDALMLLASFYDQKPDAVVFSHPNSVGATKALFDAFPKLSKIYFLPQHTEPFFHAILRYSIYELKNCLSAGTTPKHGYDDEWKAGLDIEKKYKINKSPRWAADFLRNTGSRRIALAPKGSLSGMVGSKRNIILPEHWPQIVAHIQKCGFEPVIVGVPNESKEYPALPGCVDMRHESFAGQMRCIGECAGLVGADSWAKTFSALAKIPTVVFEPIKGADIANWKDPSDWVFIEPWPAIKMVRSLDDFRCVFDAHIAKIPGATLPDAGHATIAWEGSFLDYGSLSHINRELTSRLSTALNLVCVGRNALPAAAKADPAMQECSKKLETKAPRHAAVTVRHQWPPNWSKPASGSLVAIQPWEYGMLPKAWVEASPNVDEFWVPSPIVRAMYINSGIAAEKVRVVPNGVDSRKFRPGVRPLPLSTKKKFKFLFVGGTIFRKGPDVLLEAFSQAFTAADDVCLVIKDFGGDSFYQGQTAEAAIRGLQQKTGSPEILYLTDEISSEQMPSLYAACDCLVLPYRGEGFGMPVLEAMACGLPVIVTAGGATDSFVTPEAGWKISASYIRLTDRVGETPLVKPGWMLQPSKPHLAEIFKLAAKHPEECRRRGAIGRAIVEKHFDWNDIAASVAHRLKELAQRAIMSPAWKAEPTTTKKAVQKPMTVKQPDVAKIGQLVEARELVQRKNLQGAWEATLAAVSKRPFHPEAFLVLAEIAAAAGDANIARECAQYSRHLAPAWNPTKNFSNKPLKGGAKPDWLKVPDAVKNSETETQRLSVCLIVKNEEKFLAQCLKSIKDIAQQLIVVDTGSTDRTVQIAKEFGAEIYSHAWNDDFSAARNAALEHATGDWILMLDADEELPSGQHAKLLADLKNPDVMAYRLPLVNCGQENEGRSFVPRLFRNAPGAYYFGRIHEQIFPSLLFLCKPWSLKTAMGTAEILHHGYNKEIVSDRSKNERNLKLLRQACDENPGDVNLTMNLGLELVRSENLAEGVAKYREAFQLMSELPPEEVAPELREVLLTQFTSQLYKIREHQEVIEVLTSPSANVGGLTASLHFALGLSQFELRNYGEAVEQMRYCLAKRKQPALSPINTDILSSMPNHCLALALYKLKDLAGADAAFEAARTEPGRVEDVKLDYAKFLAGTNRPVEALHKIHELVAANCHNSALWRIGGEIALSRPEFLDFARNWTGEAMRYVAEDPTIVAQRAEALMLNGDMAMAGELWEKIWNTGRQPRALAALILCDTIESQSTHAPDEGPEETAVSQAFIAWYQRLIVMRAKPVITRLNEQLDKLSRALPSATGKIEAALAESERRTTVST